MFNKKDKRLVTVQYMHTFRMARQKTDQRPSKASSQNPPSRYQQEPQAIHINLWHHALRHANDINNSISNSSDGSSLPQDFHKATCLLQYDYTIPLDAPSSHSTPTCKTIIPFQSGHLEQSWVSTLANHLAMPNPSHWYSVQSQVLHHRSSTLPMMISLKHVEQFKGIKH